MISVINMRTFHAVLIHIKLKLGFTRDSSFTQENIGNLKKKIHRVAVPY